MRLPLVENKEMSHLNQSSSLIFSFKYGLLREKVQMQISGVAQLEHEDSKHKNKSHRIWMSMKKAGISPQGPSWQGIFESKDSRKAGRSRAGLYLSSMGNICSTEKHRTRQERSRRAAQGLEHWNIEEKKST